MTRTAARLFTSLPRPSLLHLGEGLAAGCVAFALAAHVQLLFGDIRRSAWCLLFVGLTLALRWPVGRLLTWAARTVGRAGWVAVAFGGFVGVWWAGRTPHTLGMFGSPAFGHLLAVALGVSAAVAVAGLLAVLIATDPPATPTPRPPGRWWGGPLGFAALGCAAAGWYVNQETAVYFADFMHYWTKTADWAAVCGRSPAAGWEAFRESVQQPGYNLLPAVAPAAVMAVFGDGRTPYVLAVVGVHVTGLVAAGIWFVRIFAPAGGCLNTVAPAALLFVTPHVWVAAVRGYPDAGGAALGVAAVVLYLGTPRDRLRWPHLLGTVGLLVAMTLFRRWYSFWAVAFLLAIGVDAAAAAVGPLLRRRWADAFRAVRPAAAVGLGFALLLAAVAWPMLRAAVGTDHADAFAGYKSAAPFAARAESVVRQMGIGAWLLAGVSAVGLLLFAPGTRRPVLVLAGMVPVMGVLLMRVQDFDRHHLYLLVPAAALPPALAAARLPRWPAALALVALTAAGGSFLAAVFVPGAERAADWAGPLAPAAKYPPLTRGDRPEFERLLRYLDDQPGRFVVLSSSLDLHWSMVPAAGRSFGVPFAAATRQLPTREVDRVTGFPDTLLRADLVLVADPPQLHLAPAEQQTILVPHRQITAGTGVGRAFVERPERFALQHGVTVLVFRRVRPIAPSELAELSADLRAAHPDRPFVWRPSP